ncbi:MAG TPA: HepT-like ribonuclease domain-containing protein [Thermoanaerobaculia bacterium]|nr:HepT-like ribonuclease domain-containing protein [Thermoanaerobaculia bacterium]
MLRESGFLQDILLSARLAISYLERTSVEEFAKDVQLQDSVIRRLEIIGEAASHIAEEAATELPELPWRKMVDMRNFAIHQYWDVDVNIVWETVRNDLPAAVAAIERYLAL